MSKQEFIDRLRAALSGRVSASLVEENVAYYEEYINTQIRLGKPEESVLASLGDPRLIAKSIITANDGNAVNTEYNEGYNSGYCTEQSEKKSVRINGLPGWVIALIVIVVIILILSAVFSIISALLPILLPVLVVYFFIKLFRDWLK